MSRSIVVLDPSALVYDPKAPLAYPDADVHIAVSAVDLLAGVSADETEFARSSREALEFIAKATAPGNNTPNSPSLKVHLTNEPQTSLELAQILTNEFPDQKVEFVTRDTALRIKAQVLGIDVREHAPFGEAFNDDDAGGIIRINALPDRTRLLEDGKVEHHRGDVQCAVNELLLPDEAGNGAMIVREVTHNRLVTEPLRCESPPDSIWGINARNLSQEFALSLLMDPDIDLVSIEGEAGTGKTLLALAAALDQTLEQRRFVEIIVTRATIAIGNDIGFLPGTEEEKMAPWMGAVEDSLEVLLPSGSSGSRGPRNWARSASRDLIGTKIRVKSINFMRGRTFVERFVIIDEAQNLTPFQIKTLLTRAGYGTKIVLLGNLAQIDTPWLDPKTSGFSWARSRMRQWAGSAHVTLSSVERSSLAKQAVLVL